MAFLKQTWTLVKKDLLLVLYHRLISTLVRALIFPIIFALVISYIKVWTKPTGTYGVGTPSSIISFSDSLSRTPGRPRIILVDNGLTGQDVTEVMDSLSAQIRDSNKDFRRISHRSEMTTLCPSSNSGVSNCYGAVEFISSPDSGRNWSYSIYSDRSLTGPDHVDRNDNPQQLYTLPFQHAIDNAIASVNGGPGLPDNIKQYPFSPSSKQYDEKYEVFDWNEKIMAFLAFIFFFGLCGLTYHAVGHVTAQREKGLLALIDAMMPNKRRWECLAARILATHIAFDLIYLPGWIAMGGIYSAIAFPETSTGLLIGIHILAGLALMSFSMLASSLFRRVQLGAISTIVAAIVFAIVAQFGEGSNDYATTAGVLATAILFPPSTYVYIILCTAAFESERQGLLLSDSPYSVFSDLYWDVSAGTFLGLFAFQICAYPIIGAFIEKYLHGTSSKSRHVSRGGTAGAAAISLQGFSRHYKSRIDKKQTVKAVDGLTLDFHTGAINVLLGCNGSGKTTTLSAIAGLETITAGEISVDGTGGLGLCPQKNVLWDEMTVEEHVKFFENLKDTRGQTRAAHKREVQRLIEGCDLSIKTAAMAKTLSGGQKRKLQLAMAFAGGSSVCCIDEASSGIDPLARRKIWDILLAERGARTILFTTHFLDEAEALADHVAILSKGQLKAEGSVAALKSRLGGGYHIAVSNGKPDTKRVPPGINHYRDYNHYVFEASDSSGVAQVTAWLEDQGLHDYTLNGPTIEGVFLRVAAEMNADSGLARELRVGDTQETKDGVIELTQVATRDQPLILNSGVGCSPLKQTWILFLKRITVLKHNFMPYVCAMFAALVVAGMVTRFFIGYNYGSGIPCADPEGTDGSGALYAQQLDRSELAYGSFVYGPSSSVPISALKMATTDQSAPGYDDSINWRSIPVTNSSQAFSKYVRKNHDVLGTGGFYDGADGPVYAWMAGSTYYGCPILLQGLVHSVLTNQTIRVGCGYFAESFTPINGITSVIAAFVTLGFTIYPALFALYPTAERLRKVRAMHYSNGIHSSSLWMAYLLFDSMFILLISAITLAIWATYWSGWYALGYMFPVLVLYGLAATTYSYVVSLFVPSQLAAFALTAVTQFIVSMLLFVGYFVTASTAPSTEVYSWFDYMQYTVGIISPASWLLRALFMTFNDFSLLCRGSTKATYPGDLSVYGAPILYLTLQFLALSMFLMYWESGRSLEVFGIHHLKRKKTETIDPEKAAFDERARGTDAEESAERLSAENDGLRVYNISKNFGSNHAVQNVSFGVLPSEKFALLGPNGAGKSTMISLIQGDLHPSHAAHSSIHIANDNLAQEPVAAKNHLGVCPQFDSVDTMTLLEHLHFYARARGVPDKDKNINELISRLGLEEHKNKLCRKLSGGTLRKLSLAIALISNPGVLVLDEPSSGMDAAAKRALWSTLSAIAAGRVLVITTHSMEEADALCDRAGIMAGKMLALGGIDELRARHGNAAFVHLVHKDAPHTSAEETEMMRQWALRAFPGAKVDAKTFGGQLRFSVPKRDLGSNGSVPAQHDVDIGRMFRVIEEAKAELGISDYSVGPATLDQVFMNVVTKHNVQEENMKVKKGWWDWRKIMG